MLPAATAPIEIVQPAVGSPDRSAIMDAIRRGTQSTTTFRVRFLRMAVVRGAGVAYAEVSPANPFSEETFAGWALLTRDRVKGWKVGWALGDNGSTRCDALALLYRRSLSIASLYGADRKLFSPTFVDDYSRLQARPGEEECVGDLVISR